MKTGRRNFLKLLGSTGLAAPLQKLQPAIDKARVAIATRLIKIILPANGVYVPQITGCAMVDFFLSMDHPQQVMPCGCKCTPEGDLTEGCKEERRLSEALSMARLPIYRAATSDRSLTWKEYKSLRDAIRSYIRHFRATLVRQSTEAMAGASARTGERIRL